MKATIRLDPRRTDAAINPMLFGHFLENMGASLYRGGLLAPDGRPREEIVQALGEMGVSLLRWPGGLFADGYHWEEGVGASRPVVPNRYWRRFGPLLGPRDPNFFGTHEFLALCGRLGATPYINVNLGTGTPLEAARWVEYCNANSSSPLGRLRAANGRPQPWGVKIWGVGNESFGFWALGHSDAATYARRFLQFHEAMSERDATIEPVAVGTCDLWPDWNPTLLSIIGDKAAYLSVHVYLPGNQPLYLTMRIPGTAANHYALSAAYLELDRKLRFVDRQIESALGAGARLKIALDEWNLWWWWPQAYKVWWKMRDAVAVAGMAGAMVDRCETVALGNLAQAINVLGLIRTDATRFVKTPLYYVMQMFAATMRGRRVPCSLQAETFATKKLGGIPAADAVPFVSAWASVEGDRFGMIVVQRRYEGPVQVEIEAPGVRFDSVRVLSAPDPEAQNTFARPDLVRPIEHAPQDNAGGLALLLPAASLAAITGKIKK